MLPTKTTWNGVQPFANGPRVKLAGAVMTPRHDGCGKILTKCVGSQIVTACARNKEIPGGDDAPKQVTMIPAHGAQAVKHAPVIKQKSRHACMHLICRNLCYTSLPEDYQKFTSGLPEDYQKITRNLPEIYKKLTRNLQETYQKITENYLIMEFTRYFIIKPYSICNNVIKDFMPILFSELLFLK